LNNETVYFIAIFVVGAGLHYTAGQAELMWVEE
jgi:hypothetical protein